MRTALFAIAVGFLALGLAVGGASMVESIWDLGLHWLSALDVVVSVCALMAAIVLVGAGGMDLIEKFEAKESRR